MAESSALALALAAEVRREAVGTPTQLALVAVGRAALRVSPYVPTRDEEVAALRASEELRDLVLPPEWHAPLTLDEQTWVNVGGADPPTPQRFAPTPTRFPALATKPRGGMWTSTAFPDLAGVWLTGEPLDWDGGPPPGSTAWRVRPSPSARCFEIGSRADWVALCEAFPEDTTAFYRQHLDNSALHWEPPFVTPDWNAVREAYDAVHLQWAGFVDASDEVVPVLDGTTALCGWGSESTIWLRWVFDSYAAL